MVRIDVYVNSPLKAGEVTAEPLRLLLPCSQLITFVTLLRLSLRNEKRTSLDSMTTGTLKVVLWMFGFADETSVGLGTASSRAKRLVFESRRGMLPLTRLPVSPPGSLRK